MESEKLSDYPFVHPQRYRSIPGNTDSKYEQNKKLPKWLRNICTTKKCVFNNFEKYRTLLLQRLIYIHRVPCDATRKLFLKLTFGMLGSLIN